MQKRKKELEDEYRCQELLVAAPGVNIPQSNLKGVVRLHSKKGFRVLVVPVGKELEYFKAVATSGGLYDPLIDNMDSAPEHRRRLPARRGRSKSS